MNLEHSPRILVVDDHPEIRVAIARYLEKNGMRVSVVKNAKEMDKVIASQIFDLVVLDVMMPGEDGLSVCARLSRDNRMPILLLTALGEESDRITGLETGADDYLAKPFNPRELLARIRAVLRRSAQTGPLAGQMAGKRVKFDNWVLDCDRRVIVNEAGEETALTGADFKLLLVLIQRNRCVLSRDQLMDLTTGRTSAPLDRTIDNQVSRLRRKIESDPLRPRLITTVRNGGYCFATEVEVH